MSRSVWSGLVVPAVVAVVAAIAGFALGAAAALAVVAPAAIALTGFHLWQRERISRWAAAPLDTPVPEGHGSWRDVFTTLHRRHRTRLAYQRDLAHTIERFTSAAEAIPDAMAVIDAAHRIRWANARAQRLFGLDLAQDRGRPLANLVRHPAFVRYLDAGDYSASVVITSPRDASLTLAMQIVPFGVDEKLLIARDITQLEAVARMRRDFIANVSHELKTPLTVVAGFIETLQDLDLEPRQRDRYLALMLEQAGNLRRLVDDLLTLSALESEERPTADTAFAVGPLVAEQVAAARALSAGRHAIEVDVDALAPSTFVAGSREELASAFSNMVSNAIRYTPEGGTITLAWHVGTDGSGAFSVRDTGIGIAAEHIPRLTERFYRVDRSRSRATGGTGLGLAIVKHVLIRHQADLAIESAPGAGSTFTARMPASRVRVAGATERSSESGAASLAAADG